MERYSINRKTINWSKFRSEVINKIPQKNTPEDIHENLNFAIGLLRDGHSFSVKPERLKEFFSPIVQLPRIESKLLENNVAYIKIPSFIGNDSLCNLLAVEIQAIIRRHDNNNVTRWIIDLRENYGGNMWPMLLGLAPLLGEGIHGFFVDPDSVYLSWTYKGGSVFEGKRKIQQIKNPYELDTKKIKVAVLIGGNTSSSAEAIAICFKGLTSARFFGDNTYGATTSNNKFKLSDGTEMYLTVARFCDRNRVIYYNFVQPDEYISDSQLTIDSAVKWLD